MSMTVAAAPGSGDSTFQPAAPFDLAQSGPSRGVPTRTLWKQPRATASDFEKFQDKHGQALEVATKNMDQNVATLYKKLIFVSQREEVKFPEISKKAAEIAGKMTGSITETEMYHLVQAGQNIVKGYIRPATRD